MFVRNVGLAGGMAPVRAYLPELLERRPRRRDQPGPGLRPRRCRSTEVAEGYRAMDERRAIKVLLRP